MYATAHLVRSRGEEGINAFLHLHDEGFAWPSDPSALPETAPGRIVLRHVDLRPGGNEVRAYLDVLAPDGTSRHAIELALEALVKDVWERRNPTVFSHGPVTIRFGVEAGLDLLREEQLATLSSSVRSVLDAYRPPG